MCIRDRPYTNWPYCRVGLANRANILADVRVTTQPNKIGVVHTVVRQRSGQPPASQINVAHAWLRSFRAQPRGHTTGFCVDGLGGDTTDDELEISHFSVALALNDFAGKAIRWRPPSSGAHDRPSARLSHTFTLTAQMLQCRIASRRAQQMLRCCLWLGCGLGQERALGPRQRRERRGRGRRGSCGSLCGL